MYFFFFHVIVRLTALFLLSFAILDWFSALAGPAGFILIVTVFPVLILGVYVTVWIMTVYNITKWITSLMRLRYATRDERKEYITSQNSYIALFCDVYIVGFFSFITFYSEIQEFIVVFSDFLFAV